MSDPDMPARLSERGDLGAALLVSARGDAPRHEARARTAAALGLGVGVAASVATGTAEAANVVASGGAKAAGASLAPKALSAGTSVGVKAATALWLKLLAASAVTVAVAGGATVMKVQKSREHAAQVVTAQNAATVNDGAKPFTPPKAEVERGAFQSRQDPPAETQVGPVPGPVRPAPGDVTTPAASDSERGAARPTAVPLDIVPRSTPSTSVGATPDGLLTRELHSLDNVRNALARGDATTALAELDRHDRAFRTGALRTEARILRIEVLLARGDRAAARQLASELLARDPDGPHARRLRTIADAP